MASGANKHNTGENEKHPNYTMCQWFEWYAAGDEKKHHWVKFEEQSDALASMGITAAWLPPPTKGASGNKGTGYDTYDLYDLGEFDQKGSKETAWGTKEELLSAIKAAKSKGIITYIDAVLNHKMGADDKETFRATMVDQNNRNEDVSESKDIEAWTKFTFPGRGDKYSPFKWNFNHFTGVDYDDKTGTTAIFRIDGENKSWAQDVDKEKGSYDFLMGADVDHAHPDVEKEINDWGTWAIKETGARGFRFDAVKHISEEFVSQFIQHVRDTLEMPLFAVGEFWHDDIDTLVAYLDRFGAQFSCFDSPLQANFKEAGEAKENFDLRTIFDGTLVQRRPIDAVTLVDNHDTQVGQSLERWVSSGFKPLAYALILFRVDGYPCVFYGDLYGCGGENPQQPMSQLDDFVRIRKLFTYGDLNDYFDHPNCLGWVRTGDEDHDGCAIVLCNGTADGSKKMEVGKEHAGEKWTDVLGWHQGEITIDEEGWAEFACGPESVSVWTKTDARGRDEFKKD